MGPRHTKQDILSGALAEALDGGLSQLTYGRVAKRLGINDRIVVYYFPTKDDLITQVLVSIGTRLQESLSQAFTAPAADHLELARSAWPILAHREVDPIFALFFEANGLAAAGREPYRSLISGLVEAWIEWLATLLSGTAAQRRGEATAAIALIDGLLLLRQMAGSHAADQAAATLGIR
jgi:AcrR family transcriptional regulator